MDVCQHVNFSGERGKKDRNFRINTVALAKPVKFSAWTKAIYGDSTMRGSPQTAQSKLNGPAESVTKAKAIGCPAQGARSTVSDCQGPGVMNSLASGLPLISSENRTPSDFDPSRSPMYDVKRAACFGRVMA